VNREEWLHTATEKLRPLLEEHGAQLPQKLQISVGFPKASKNAAGRAIGQCWGKTATENGTTHVFVCPTLGSDMVMVLAVLLHELVHAAVGVECKHRGLFAKTMRALGYQGKLTMVSTELITVGLKTVLEQHAQVLGTYPHDVVHVPLKPQREKSLNIVLKSTLDEKYKIGMKRDLWEEKGAPLDPWGTEMVPVRGDAEENEVIEIIKLRLVAAGGPR
jgi:hypothetical protein